MPSLRGFHFTRTCRCVVYPCNVVHASSDEEHAIRRPSEVVYLSAAARPAHGLYSPMFHIFIRIVTKVGSVGGIVGGSPQEDIAVVSG